MVVYIPPIVRVGEPEFNLPQNIARTEKQVRDRVGEPEFNLPQNIARTEKEVRDILMKADRDGDGCLSKDELKKAFKEFGSWMPCLRASCCLKKVDTNRDGKISREGIDFVVDYVLAWLESKK